MGAPVGVAGPAVEAGLIAAVAATIAAFLLPTARGRALAMSLALALVPVLVVAEVWDTQQVRDVRDSPAIVAVALVVGLAAALAIAWLVARRPSLLPLLAVGALPFRVPMEVGGSTANLLVPLYLVIAGGVIAYAWERLRGDAAPRVAPRERRGSGIELALLLALAAYALQSVYSSDFEQALENAAFFYVPFALLLRLLAGTEWTARLAGWCLAVAVGLALAFVAIGFWEYASKQLLWNPKVIASNQFETYFRVNSLFFDPNIYGRFLAVVMTGLAAVVLWSGRWSGVLGAAAALAILLAGLVLTFSQSSLAALLVSLVVLAALRWPLRPVMGATVVIAVVGAIAIVAFPGVSKVDIGDGRSLDEATSGRVELIEGGVEMFLDRPFHGFGSGAFAERFREREEVSEERAASASHTTPVTIAAEQGVPGLITYAIVLVAAFALLFAQLGGLRHPTPTPDQLARGMIAAAFAGLVVHTLAYAAFLEDPLTWTLLGTALGLAASAGPAGPSASERAAARMRTRSSSP